MLQTVDVEIQPLHHYAPHIGEEKLDELRELASGLRGARVVHLSATPYGGGVSELLRSLVPIERALGVEADWRIITGDEAFFEVTKKVHNVLQGAGDALDSDARELYLANSRRNAELLERSSDFVVVHDPQPLPIRSLKGDAGAKWVWRCHIDTSQPDPGALEFLAGFVSDYDALVFTMPEFMPPAWKHPRVVSMAPGIDPLSPKNMTLPEGFANQIARWLGVDPERPLLTQVSRFDPWKDPLGVVEVYREVREDVPGLQLALLGSMALDDPGGWGLYEQIRDEVGDDREVHVATNITGVSNIEVNSFQRCSDVVIQKSIREGFGLVVSETLWKGTPVVAGRAGGIPAQMPEGIGGLLVDDTAEWAPGLLRLLREPDLARELGERGREHVREHFLVTRLVADELGLLGDLS